MAEQNVEILTKIVLEKLMRKQLTGISRVTERDIINNLRNLADITIAVTERCNLNCSYCVYGGLYETDPLRNNRDLNEEAIRKLFNFLSDYWQDRVKGSIISIAFYGGEPLLNMKLVKHTVEYLFMTFPNFKFTFRITSNGLLLNKYMDFLVEKSFKLLISLDGNRFHNSHRVTQNGKESFDIVVKNVDKLKEVYPDYFEKYVSFNAVLHNRNNAIEVLDFIKNKYGKKPKLSPLATDGINKENGTIFNSILNKNSILPGEYKSFKDEEEFVNSSIGKNIRQLLSTIGMNYHDYSSLIYSNSRNEFHTGSCTPLRKLFLSADGKILPCANVSHRYVLADVHELNKIDILAIADKHNDLINRFYNSVCQKCASITICHTCIYSRDWTGDGEVGHCRHLTNINKLISEQNMISRYLASYPDAYFRLFNFFNNG